MGGNGAVGGGFDAGIAGQWNANVQRGVEHRQNQHDASVAGPPVRLHGGTRITQGPGGGASIDLSWGGGGTQGSGSSAGAHPPRMPGPPCGQVGMGQGGPGGNANYGQQAPTPQYSDAQRYARGPSPSRGLSHSPSHAAAARGGAPFGRDDDPYGGRAPMQVRRDAAPFGVDAQPQPSAGGLGMRRASPSPQRRVAPDSGFYGDAPAAGCGLPRGRGANGRPPGGASSFVFG